jgi:uncharacterized membrane protein YukC
MCAVAVLAVIFIWWAHIFIFIRRQEKINEAIANYVAADLKQTWQKSARELVIAIRGRDGLDNADA